MVGFHMMHQNARQNVFPLTRQYRVGTLLMFAVRNIFSQPGRLQRTMREVASAEVITVGQFEKGALAGSG
jgi:hypothetical protein